MVECINNDMTWEGGYTVRPGAKLFWLLFWTVQEGWVVVFAPICAWAMCGEASRCGVGWSVGPHAKPAETGCHRDPARGCCIGMCAPGVPHAGTRPVKRAPRPAPPPTQPHPPTQPPRKHTHAHTHTSRERPTAGPKAFTRREKWVVGFVALLAMGTLCVLSPRFGYSINHLSVIMVSSESAAATRRPPAQCHRAAMPRLSRATRAAATPARFGRTQPPPAHPSCQPA